jgi:hypothetical protein
MEIKKKTGLTFNDYLDFNYHFARKRSIPLFVLIIICLVMLILSVGISNDWAAVFSSRYIFYYAIILLLPFISFLVLRFTAKKQYESNKLMKSETETILNETGISQSSKYGNTSVEWVDLYKVEEAKSAFYIYIAKRQAFILPKRILENGEAAAVRTLITRCMAPNKYRFLKQR